MHLDRLVWTAHVGGVATLFSDGHLRIGSDSDGVFAELTDSGGPVRINTGAPLRPRQWYRVWLSADPSNRVMHGRTTSARLADIVQASDQLNGLQFPAPPRSCSRPIRQARPGTTSPASSKPPPSSRALSPTGRPQSRPSSPLGIFRSASRRRSSPTRALRLATATSSIFRHAPWSAPAGPVRKCAGAMPRRTMPPSNSTMATSTIAAGMLISPGPSLWTCKAAPTRCA
jgi:hypothetical protein